MTESPSDHHRSIGYWARVGAVSVAAGALVTVLLGGIGYGFVRTTIVHSVVYSSVLGALCGFVLPQVAHRVHGARVAVRWGVLLPTLALIAVGGTAIACAILLGLGLTAGRSVWSCFASDVWITAAISGTVGVGMLFYESQRAELKTVTLELRTRQLEHERASKMALEAQLSSLESRLQPHFLFNTLNSISALIHEDPERAERTVERLAALLRFSLDATERGTAPLSHELKIVTDYLEIEKTRLGDRLTYAINVPPDLGAVEVPPLSVQTLVENSIKHAIAPRPSGGRLRVDAWLDGGSTIIGVWDDGPGFTSAAIVPGHGLENLQSRLAVRFGSAARLDVSRRDGGTLVTMSLPRPSP